MIVLGEFLSINHGNDGKDLVIFEFMEVTQHNVSDDIVGKGKLEWLFLTLEGIDPVKLIDDVGDKISR